MYLIQEYKNTIIEVLKELKLNATFKNKAGYFNLNKDAEEFYRGLLNLFYDWNLEPLNTENEPNYEGADLGDIGRQIAVQVTSENDSDKVHNSIKGFINKCLPDGYKTLYVLMFRGKDDYPRANFAKSVDKKFKFDKAKHIIDHSDLCAKLKDIKFDKLTAIYDYLDKMVGFDERSQEEKKSRKLLAMHADYQRWLYEENPVLRISPFALQHVYTETDCAATTWEEFRQTEHSRNSSNTETKVRKPLLKTVMNLIADKNLSDAIIIQGIAGSGKSSFTLRLCNELLEKGLQPICIRIGELTFDTHIKDALPKAVRLNRTDDIREDNLFLNDEIFKESGVGDFEHISKYVLILDGWDEISQSQEGFKKKVAKMLNEINDYYLSNKRPKIRVILTGRPTVDFADSSCLREKSPFLTLLKFTPEQLESYVSKILTAVNSEKPLIELNELTEFLKVPDNNQFAQVFERYANEFKKETETKLEVLGLPLLTYLTVRLVSEWKGDLTPLLENQTTLYRHLIDLTCKNAARIDSNDENKDQHKLYGDELRDLLRQTASAITVCSGENISQQELALRLNLDDKELNKKADELQKESKLSALLISFYFKGGNVNLGCEFAHKSFREYFYAEAIVETLKEYGRRQLQTPPPRKNYWEDFNEFERDDKRHWLSRRLSELLAPQWLTQEIKTHLREILFWEIARSIKPDGKKPIGTPTEPITKEQWLQIRTGLADLWEWWGEGVHLRLQPSKNRNQRDPNPPYVQELVKWSALQSSQNVVEYARTTTMDAHLGDGIFELTAIVHDQLAYYSEDNGRKYQSLNNDKETQRLMFRPTGEKPYYFRNYIARINSAGWRASYSDWKFSDEFPINTNFGQTDLSHTSLNNLDFTSANFTNATLENAYFHRSSFFEAVFINTNLQDADFIFSDLTCARIENSILKGVDFSNLEIDEMIIFDIFDLDIDTALIHSIKQANFNYIYLDGKRMSRDEAFNYLDLKLIEYKEKLVLDPISLKQSG